MIGLSALLKIVKEGNENSGNYDHEGRPGQVGGSSTDGGGKELSWKDSNSKLELNRQFKEKFGIKKVKATDIKTINKFGQFMCKLGNRFPVIQERLLAHKLNQVDFQNTSTLINRRGLAITANGLYEHGIGGKARIDIFNRENFDSFLNTREGYLAGTNRGHTVGYGMGNTINHELGHHIHSICISPAAREKWEKVVSEVKDFRQVSRYAMTNSKEAFAESFAKFIHPQYKDDLPKPVHDFMSKILTPKVKKQIGLSKILKIGMVEGKFSSFSFTPEQVKTFAEKANLKIADNEPKNGGFAVRKEDLKKYEIKNIRKQIKGYLRG